MEQQFPFVWLAYPQKFNRSFKFLVYDDKGILEIARNEIRFRNDKKSLLISRFNQVSLVKQPPPWLNWLVSNGLILLGIAGGFFKTITWQDPLTIPLLGVLNFFLVLVWWLQKWVKVEYLDEAGLPQQIYFTDGAFFGWGSLLGGAAKLHWALESCLQPESDPRLFDRRPAIMGLLPRICLPACLIAFLLPVVGESVEPAKQPPRSPLTPQEAVKYFQLPAGLRIELVAAEPQIESPVAMAFDEDGKLWVVEMRDYPNGPEKGQPPEGRIKVLEDQDGDGRYETSRIFAEGLLFANGLLPWNGGVIVTAAPHIVYLKDTDGDGKADQRDVLYEGFATENPQLRVSHPVLGLDNWIYVANGLRGGQIKRSGKADAKPINISGMDFRFDLLHDRAEAITGMGQYGNTFDDWGNRFVCTNRNHLIPIVLPNRYVQRNPFMVAPEPVRDNQTAGGAAKIHPLSKNFTTASSHAGTFSASCGVTIYRGDALPKDYRGAAFTCEPTGTLVHMDVLLPQGAGFGSKPAFEGKEFLASPDDWFRPVSLAHAPDGALYVVDMYREVIEHPQFMTPEYKARANLTAGKDKGRIWRIVPEKFSHAPGTSALGKLKTTELVQLLAHPNSWQRTTAQRLLLERQDQAAVPALRTMTSSANPLAQVQAAWLLEAYGALEEKLILNDMLSKGAGGARVEEHAVRLLERWLPKSKPAQELVVKLADSPDARVRFQAALSLGEWDDDAIAEPLAKIALSGGDDKWTRAAVATAVPKRSGMLIAKLLGKNGQTAIMQDQHSLVQELSTLAGARGDAEEIAALFAVLSKLNDKDALAWRMTVINGIAEGMGRRGTQLSAFLNSLPPEKQQASKQAEVLLKEAASVAADAKRETAERVSAAKLLAHASWATAEPVLLPLILQDPAQEVRLAAVRALAAQPRAEVPALLMKSWTAYPPAMRREVMEAMLRQPERIQFLLNELEAKRIKPGDFDAPRTRQLVNHGRPEIRELARKLLQDNLPADRKVVLEKYREALKLTGDTLRGKEVFQKNCATCHRVAGVGVEVGPSIADTLGKTPEALLTDVLNPNQAIDNNFINYTVTTKSGKVLTGIIVAETASSITLKRAENQGDVVLRQDLEDIQSTGISLMPEGVEKTINLQEMADLLHFLKNWRYLDEVSKPK